MKLEVSISLHVRPEMTESQYYDVRMKCQFRNIISHWRQTWKASIVQYFIPLASNRKYQYRDIISKWLQTGNASITKLYTPNDVKHHCIIFICHWQQTRNASITLQNNNDIRQMSDRKCQNHVINPVIWDQTFYIFLLSGNTFHKHLWQWSPPLPPYPPMKYMKIQTSETILKLSLPYFRSFPVR